MSVKKKPKILIADDERTNIIALAQILMPQYEVIVATGGNSAIEAAEKHAPDLILLDVIMPDLDGFEVIRKLRDYGFTKDIPVIFITGLDNSTDEEKSFFLGAVDYITKPFNNSIVKARVNTHLKMADYVRTIERLCLLDTLTELPNRRAFDNHVNVEWERAFREKKPISVLMIDVDKFKIYNDTYGHPQGDFLLQSLAEIFRQTLKRASDFVARWGGEEFIVSLSNTDLDGALTVAEEIRENVEQTEISCSNGGSTAVTVSIGAASKVPKVDDSITNLISMADEALYTAKNSGRNRVCAYT